MKRPRVLPALLLAISCAEARADEPPRVPVDDRPRALVVDIRAGLAGDAPLGDASRLVTRAFGIAAGASARRPGSPWRYRFDLELEPFTDIDPGVSLALVGARLGIERSWRGHVFAALGLGGAARRISVSDEITRWTMGPAVDLEGGARFSLSERWALTTSVRYALAWYTQDLFLWHQIGLLVTVERRMR